MTFEHQNVISSPSSHSRNMHACMDGWMDVLNQIKAKRIVHLKNKKELIEQIKTETESTRFDLELYKIINIVKMKNKCRKRLISI